MLRYVVVVQVSGDEDAIILLRQEHRRDRDGRVRVYARTPPLQRSATRLCVHVQVGSTYVRESETGREAGAGWRVL